MVAGILDWIGGFFKSLFAVVLDFLGRLLTGLIQGIITVLKTLFRPVLILVAIIFYFVYKVAELFLALLSVMLAIARLLYSFVQGLIVTIAGFSWTPTTPDHGSWSSAIGEVFDGLAYYQLDKLAYVLLFAIWIMTGVGAIRILTARR